MSRRLLFEPPNATLVAVARQQRVFELKFSDGTTCLIQPQAERGMRTLYAFSTEVIRRSAWIDVREELLVIGKTLIFEMVGTRNFPVGGDLILTTYRGMRS